MSRSFSLPTLGETSIDEPTMRITMAEECSPAAHGEFFSGGGVLTACCGRLIAGADHRQHSSPSRAQRRADQFVYPATGAVMRPGRVRIHAGHRLREWQRVSVFDLGSHVSAKQQVIQHESQRVDVGSVSRPSFRGCVARAPYRRACP